MKETIFKAALIGFVPFILVLAILCGAKNINDYQEDKRLAEEAALAEEVTLAEASKVDEETLKALKEEEERQRELERQAIEIERKSYADKLPYEGMDSEFIDDTLVGEHVGYEFEKTSVAGKTAYKSKYIWYAANRRDVTLVVTCMDGKVTDVHKFHTNTYWDSQGNPQSYKTHSNSSYSNTSSRLDKYEVYDYDDPDDFADKWYDEFGYSYEEGYDEAYSYWETYYEDSKKEYNRYYDEYDVGDYDDPDDFAEEWEDEFGDYDDAYEYWEDNY